MAVRQRRKRGGAVIGLPRDGDKHLGKLGFERLQLRRHGVLIARTGGNRLDIFQELCESTFGGGKAFFLARDAASLYALGAKRERGDFGHRGFNFIDRAFLGQARDEADVRQSTRFVRQRTRGADLSACEVSRVLHALLSNGGAECGGTTCQQQLDALFFPSPLRRLQIGENIEHRVDVAFERVTADGQRHRRRTFAVGGSTNDGADGKAACAKLDLFRQILVLHLFRAELIDEIHEHV